MLEQQYIIEFCKFLTKNFNHYYGGQDNRFWYVNLECPLPIFLLWCVSPRYKDELGYQQKMLAQCLQFLVCFFCVLTCLASSCIRKLIELKLIYKCLKSWTLCSRTWIFEWTNHALYLLNMFEKFIVAPSFLLCNIKYVAIFLAKYSMSKNDVLNIVLVV